MNHLDLTLYPELTEQAHKAARISMEMEVDGHAGPWELGPLCTRDHATHLHELKEAVKEFLKILPSPHCDDIHHPMQYRHPGHIPCPLIKEYATAKQRIHSLLKAKP